MTLCSEVSQWAGCLLAKCWGHAAGRISQNALHCRIIERFSLPRIGLPDIESACTALDRRTVTLLALL